MPSIHASQSFIKLLSNHLKILHYVAQARDWLGGTRLIVRGSRHSVSVHQSRLIRTNIKIEGKNNTLEIQEGTRLIDSVILIQGSGHHVQIGRNCILNRMTLVLESSDCQVRIGSLTTSSSVYIYIGEPHLSLRIGDDCMISHRVEIMCSDSHSLNDAATGDRLNYPANVDIGDHVWLGAESAILKGAIIGDHSTIGFRSVVTNQIQPHSLAVGIPARIIRTGVTWTRDLTFQLLYH
jgi:acetyltransferase-like isoleucine patch superfamily enzyme